MTDIRIPKHVAAMIERRWAEKLARERGIRRMDQSIDAVHDR